MNVQQHVPPPAVLQQVGPPLLQQMAALHLGAPAVQQIPQQANGLPIPVFAPQAAQNGLVLRRSPRKNIGLPPTRFPY